MRVVVVAMCTLGFIQMQVGLGAAAGAIIPVGRINTLHVYRKLAIVNTKLYIEISKTVFIHQLQWLPLGDQRRLQGAQQRLVCLIVFIVVGTKIYNQKKRSHNKMAKNTLPFIKYVLHVYCDTYVH